MLTLYIAPGSSSMATHIALLEVGAPFDLRIISFKERQHRSPNFLAINPEGKLPVLVDEEGRSLTEVAATLYFIARRFPDAALWPRTGIADEAAAVSWMSYCASTLHPARRQGVEAALTAYRMADRRLGMQDWIVGDYSVADIHLFRLYWRIRKSFRPDTNELPALERHHARMMQRPAVQRAIAAESAIGYELPS